jgi:hypothetical protein
MKFHEVREGQRFEFEGEIYVKVNQLRARHAGSGRYRVIRRSATVKSLPAAMPADDLEAVSRLPVADVLTAFDVFYRRCRHCLEAFAARPDSRSLEIAYDDLEAARQRFLDRLGLRS